MEARPSTYILRKAWLLGQMMARTERRLRPNVGHARIHPSYASFRQFHRCEMENNSGFAPWDEKLQKLIEREGNGRGVPIDNPHVWQAFYTYFGEPIRSVFWAAWEDSLGLQNLYDQEVARIQRNRDALPAMLHVSNSALAVDDHAVPRDSILGTVFDSRDDAPTISFGRRP